MIVIGAGITGSIAACLLHDSGLGVRLVDLHGAPMGAASRWNEGKLHLGYTYTGTESLDTARLMLEGTASFARIIRAVCGAGIDATWWSQPVIYIVDSESIFPVDRLWARAQSVAALIGEAAKRNDALQPFTDPPLERIGANEVQVRTGQRRVVGGWLTGERAVSPRPVADLLVGAVSRRRIETIAARATSVTREGASWALTCEDGTVLASRAIVNASWESRRWLDRSVAPVSPTVSIRYKVSLFASRPQGWGPAHPSTRILGAFGDVTPYGDGNVYLSWYPAGLLASSEDGTAPAIPAMDRPSIVAATLAALGLAGTDDTGWTVAGGYVVAEGKGSITDRTSSLHERHRPDARRLAPMYVSVDSGKYTLGPLLAERAAALLLAEWRRR